MTDTHNTGHDESVLGEETGFQAHYTPPAFDQMTAKVLKTSPFQRNRKILTALSLEEAVKGADTYAKTKVLSGPFVLGSVRLCLEAKSWY